MFITIASCASRAQGATNCRIPTGRTLRGPPCSVFDDAGNPLLMIVSSVRIIATYALESGLYRRSATKCADDRADNQKNQENVEKNLRDSGGSAGNSAEPEKTGNDR